MFQTGNASNDLLRVTKSDIVVREVTGQGYVLSEEDSDGNPRIQQNRLNVLMDIYAESFEKYFTVSNWEECEKIVDGIYDATCGKADREDREGTTDSCNFSRGRFLVKEIAPGSDIGWEWRKLDVKSSKELIYKTLESRIEKKRESVLLEADDFLDAIGYVTMEAVYDSTTNGSPKQRPVIRRSRSASNMMLDAENACDGLLDFYDKVDFEDDVDVNDFEPLPITSSCNSNEISDALKILDHELNNRKKKRGRRRSLLRRSNSFESTFDKKKIFKNINKDLRSSKHQPSFIRHDDSVYAPTRTLSSKVSRVLDSPQFMSNVFRYKKDSGSSVPIHEGMDIVLLGDRKTLSANPTILGNNRLRILLSLERRRFHVLTPDEQQETANDLISTITKCWNGRVLMESGPSYNVLSYEDATNAMFGLLLGDNIRHRRASQPESSILSIKLPDLNTISSTSPSSKAKATPSLLAAAPPLPEFLQAASRDILKLGRNKSSSKMTPAERQAAAIEGLKERNKNRELAKQKNNNKDLTKEEE